jgi:hypothetical protein
MKNTIAILTACAALSMTALAQDVPPQPGGMPPGGGPPTGGSNQQQGRQMRNPPIPLIFKALDTNHDGYIDAEEMANAPVVLKSLDKTGDGKLSLEEALGPRPQGMNQGGMNRPPGQWRGQGQMRPPGGNNSNGEMLPPPGGEQGPPPENQGPPAGN